MAIGLKQLIDNFNLRSQGLYTVTSYNMEALRLGIAFMSFQTVTGLRNMSDQYNWVIGLNNAAPPDPVYYDPTSGA